MRTPERADKPTVALQDSIPVWVHAPGAAVVTSEIVRAIADEENTPEPD